LDAMSATRALMPCAGSRAAVPMEAAVVTVAALPIAHAVGLADFLSVIETFVDVVTGVRRVGHAFPPVGVALHRVVAVFLRAPEGAAIGIWALAGLLSSSRSALRLSRLAGFATGAGVVCAGLMFAAGHFLSPEGAAIGVGALAGFEVPVCVAPLL